MPQPQGLRHFFYVLPEPFEVTVRIDFFGDVIDAKEIIGKSERTIKDTEKRRQEDMYCNLPN